MKLRSEDIPLLFVNLMNSDKTPEHVILVEKRTQTAWILRVQYPKMNCSVVKTLPVSTGSRHGDKEIEGDLKTPEGFYLIESFIPEKDLHQRYGSGAYVLNYPNDLDRILKKTGSGIWLHGTDMDRLIPYDTRGCVRFLNYDLLDLGKYILQGVTPVIIQEKVAFCPIQEVRDLGSSIPQLLDNWKKCWEDLDVEAFLKFYHPEFFSTSLDYDIYSWNKHKKNIFRQTAFNSIRILKIQYLYKKGHLLIRFRLEYSSDSRRDTGLKTLLWKESSTGWLILREEWQ